MKKVSFVGDVPMCANSASEYRIWKEAARQSSGIPAGFCTDCTPEYQKKMIAEKRCENPQVVFVRDDDGWISGALVGERSNRELVCG